ncbi:hypothetical protein D3C86_1326670 [compost metagenome]
MAGILRTAPVRGLRPSRAARWRTWKVPKPTRVTLWPRERAWEMASMVALRHSPASFWETFALVLIALMSSSLFIAGLSS